MVKKRPMNTIINMNPMELKVMNIVTPKLPPKKCIHSTIFMLV